MLEVVYKSLVEKDPLSSDSCWLYKYTLKFSSTTRLCIFVFAALTLSLSFSLLNFDRFLFHFSHNWLSLAIVNVRLVWELIFIFIFSNPLECRWRNSHNSHIALAFSLILLRLIIIICGKTGRTPKSHYHHFCIALGQWNNVYTYSVLPFFAFIFAGRFTHTLLLPWKL